MRFWGRHYSCKNLLLLSHDTTQCHLVLGSFELIMCPPTRENLRAWPPRMVMYPNSLGVPLPCLRGRVLLVPRLCANKANSKQHLVASHFSRFSHFSAPMTAREPSAAAVIYFSRDI